MNQKRERFYGWWLVAAACVVYGFGITPGYFSWGQFFNALHDELGYTRADLGLVFGLFTFLYSGVGPLVGWAQRRFSIRAVMTAGAMSTTIGYIIVSRAHTMPEFLIGFSILGGAGVGFSTIVPCQTLGQTWFLKRRATAIAIMMASGSVVGLVIPKLDEYMLAHYTWREGWLVLAGLSAIAAVVAMIFIRDAPEQVGQHRDGIVPDSQRSDSALAAKSSVADLWTAGQAMRTHQFWLIVLAGTAYAVPWGTIISHGASHIRDNPAIAPSVGLLMTLPSLAGLFGRLSGSLGDWLPPQAVLVGSLLLEGVGCIIFLYANTVTLSAIGLSIFGIGFGTAYVSIPVVFTHFFGRGAFGVTSGWRMFVTGIFNGIMPFITGWLFDLHKNYITPFWALFGIAMAGAIAAAVARNPGAPPVAMQTPPNEVLARTA